jgi:hypothetical protein
MTTGDFEQYVAHDVIAYVDSHYRTLAGRASRGWLATPWEATERPASA